MYEAYAVEEIVSNLPFQATCITYHNKQDRLYVGSKQGHLLSCGRRIDGKIDYQVKRTFEKSSIMELKVVESHDLILCFTTDSLLTVHSAIDPFSLLDIVNKYRPISSFTCCVSEDEANLILAVCVRKRIHLFKWNSKAFDEVDAPTLLTLSDNARAICWAGTHSLILAIRAEFSYMKVFVDESDSIEEADEVGRIRSLISMGARMIEAPLLYEISEKSWVGLRCESTIAFVNEKGAYMCECRFSDIPLALAYDSPYLLALLPKGIVEIRVIQSSMLIQKREIDGLITICSGNPGIVCAGSERSALLLNAKSLIRNNLKFLTDMKQFELAVTIANRFPDHVEKSSLVETYRRYAYALFIEKKFTECFNNHSDIKTDVLLVMNFLPFLIPERYAEMLSRYSADELSFFNMDISNFSEADRRTAIIALSVYLAAKRTEYAQMLSIHNKEYKAGHKENLLPTKVVKKYVTILELVDTVLLKCYILTKPSMVPSLLRLPDNGCIISEAEKDLYAQNRFADLLILYERKRMHRKALELLKKESKKEESVLSGLESMVEYLHNLLSVDIKLVFEYAPFVFDEDDRCGLQIFTGLPDVPDINVPKLDHDEILQFLGKHSDRDSITLYLEHIVYNLHEQRPKFHDLLADCYVTKVKSLMKDNIHTLTDDKMRMRGGEEEGELGEMRTKLMRFLEVSRVYSAEELLEKLNDYLLEEKAILYGRLKEHDKAFSIYANILMDFKAAEKHCSIYYDASDPINSQVYFKLFKAYTSPLGFTESEFRPKFMQQSSQPNMTEALKVLRKYPDKIDIVSAISEIPMDAPLSRVWEPLEAAYVAMKNRVNTAKMHLAVSRKAVKTCEKMLQEIRSERIVIDSVECKICRKKIADSAFVRHPDKSIMHYFCYKNSESMQNDEKN